MTTRGRLTFFGMVGVLIYGAAEASSLLLYPHFWTSSTMGQGIPWFYMGQAFISGLCATLALLATIALGSIARRSHGRAVWGSLFPALLFLSMPVGRGLSVLLFTRRIWEGAASASSQWKSYQDYAYGTIVASAVALAVTLAVVLRYRRAWSQET